MMTVLLVEDLEDLREILQRTLVANGFKVLATADAEGALRLASQQQVQIDLLLTDWQLPGMSGWELAMTLVAQHPRMRVLLTSGQIKADDLSLNWLKGWGEYLAKPYDLAVMLAALQRLSSTS
jgi:DNA-binding response OmpR family regulator